MAVNETEVIVWEGADQLRSALRPVTDLTRHPRNPKRGDVNEIAASLARFGQVRAVLLSEDDTVVAGNHTLLAAIQLGWTHIAAIRNPFSTEEEARAYLLGDNRLGDLGEYDRAELIAAVAELEELGRWEGTGYVQDDLAQLRALEAAANAPPPDPVPSGDVEPGPPVTFREIVLLFDDDQQGVFAEKVRLLRTRYGLEGVSDTVMQALHDEALQANQGEAA